MTQTGHISIVTIDTSYNRMALRWKKEEVLQTATGGFHSAP